jgi:hypothetical protein
MSAENPMPAKSCLLVLGAALALLRFAPTAFSQQSPLPFIAAPSPSPSASAEPPRVEQPPARLRTGPPRIACWAMSSNTKAYGGYYLGGGTASCRGQPRLVTEGTWGWDYQGWLMPRRIFLQWWHGRRYQNGAGAYRIEGPHPLKALSRVREGSEPP